MGDAEEVGMPDHVVSMFERPHAGAVVNVKTGEGDTAMDSLTGVRQGACEGPILIILTMQAELGTMEWPVSKPTSRTHAGGLTSGGGSTSNAA